MTTMGKSWWRALASETPMTTGVGDKLKQVFRSSGAGEASSSKASAQAKRRELFLGASPEDAAKLKARFSAKQGNLHEMTGEQRKIFDATTKLLEDVVSVKQGITGQYTAKYADGSKAPVSKDFAKVFWGVHQALSELQAPFANSHAWKTTKTTFTEPPTPRLVPSKLRAEVPRVAATAVYTNPKGLKIKGVLNNEGYFVAKFDADYAATKSKLFTDMAAGLDFMHADLLGMTRGEPSRLSTPPYYAAPGHQPIHEQREPVGVHSLPAGDWWRQTATVTEIGGAESNAFMQTGRPESPRKPTLNDFRMPERFSSSEGSYSRPRESESLRRPTLNDFRTQEPSREPESPGYSPRWSFSSSEGSYTRPRQEASNIDNLDISMWVDA